MDQLGVRSLFTGKSQPGEPSCDIAKMRMMEMIHDGCCYEDGQVDDSEPGVHAQQPGMYIKLGTRPGTYTQQPDSHTV